MIKKVLAYTLEQHGYSGKVTTCASELPLMARVFLLNATTGVPFWHATSKPDGSFDFRGLPNILFVPVAILLDGSNADVAKPRFPKQL